MLRRRARAATRGDDWGCCPAKPVQPVQRENDASIHYKNSPPTANEVSDVAQSGARWSWSGAGVGGDLTPDNSTDPVTAAAASSAGLNAAGSRSASGTCCSSWWSAPIYIAVVASSVVVVALCVSLFAVLATRRRRRLQQHNSADGGSHARSGGGGGGGQWNKKLAGILAPAHSNLLRPQAKPAAPSDSPATASSTLSSAAKRPLSTANQRHGYTPLPGTVYPAAAAQATRRDPNPYGLPPSQCSYQPRRVRFVSLHRRRTIDSQTADSDDSVDVDQPSSRQQFPAANSEIPVANDLQALLPLTSLKSLFGVVSGVFGVTPAFDGAQRPVVSDRRASRCVPGVNDLTAPGSTLPTRGLLDFAKAALSGNGPSSSQAVDAMGTNASSCEPPVCSSDPTTTPPAQASPNDVESVSSSADACDEAQLASIATMASSTASQSADVDLTTTDSDDVVSPSMQSLRHSIAEKCSVDGSSSTRRQSAQSTGSTMLDSTSHLKLGRIGGLVDAIGLGDLVRSVTGNQPTEADKVEPFWVPPGLQVQKRRAQSLQSAPPLPQFDTANENAAKNGEVPALLSTLWCLHN